ncbi:hypothetical protein [Variovorax sp. 770b2]|uniref:hypothetical protein n=1 Tax=Variovorax sp. 770b2 TaxID=1566271 RepID=UPI0008F188FE|nr:hypothetical protein [Variovorax sp. 770b2]SFQ32709.1 hypothetical protein SAMN03159339_6737 [Variovorax sp. 770b2]
MVIPTGTPPFPSPIVQPESSALSKSPAPTVKHAPKSQSVIPSLDLDLAPPRVNTRRFQESGPPSRTQSEERPTVSNRGRPRRALVDFRRNVGIGLPPDDGSRALPPSETVYLPTHGTEGTDTDIQTAPVIGGNVGVTGRLYQPDDDPTMTITTVSGSVILTSHAPPSEDASPRDPARALLQLRHAIDNLSPEQSAQARTFMDRLLSAVRGMDVWAALSKGDEAAILADRNYQQGVRDIRQDATQLLEGVQASRANMPEANYNAATKNLQRAHRLLDALAGMELSTMKGKGALAALVLSNAALMAINLAAFVYLPFAKNENKTKALYLASASKTMFLTLGLMWRMTTNRDVIFNLNRNRNFVNTLQSALFYFTLLADYKALPKAAQNGYAATVGVVSAAAGISLFYGPEMWAGIKKLSAKIMGSRDGMPDEMPDDVLQSLQTLKQQADALTNTPRALTVPTPDGRGMILGEFNDLDEFIAETGVVLNAETTADLRNMIGEPERRGQIQDLRKGMSSERRVVNDSHDYLAGEAEKALNNARDAIAASDPTFAPPARALTESQQAAKAEKGIYSVVGAASLAGPVPFFAMPKVDPSIPLAPAEISIVGLVDLAANMGMVMTVLINQVFDETKSSQAQKDSFRQLCGFSAAMAVVLTGNHLMGDPIESAENGWIYGGLILATVGNTFPGVFGTVLAAILAGTIGEAKAEWRGDGPIRRELRGEGPIRAMFVGEG